MARDAGDRAGSTGKRVTLTQVAERAGVSVSAVSFVMNGRTDQRLSSETQEKVRRAAADLGYRPNRMARALRTGQSGTVAFVSDFVSSTSFANTMVRGAITELRERDQLLFAVDTQGDAELEKRLLQNLLDRQVDGVIYASMFTRQLSVPPVLRQLPYVLLNCIDDPLSAPAVVPDEVEAGRTAARLLLDAGHGDRVVFVGTFRRGQVGGAAWHGWAPIALTDRLSGIRAEMSDAGRSLAATVDVEVDWDIEHGREAVGRLIAEGPLPTALVCVNDAVALGAVQALHAAGHRVPEDVSIVSFDGSVLTDVGEPSITSVALPHAELGAIAVRLLRDDTAAPGETRVSMPVKPGHSITAPRAD
ncbi:LacI family DNA-binding transcriptional regulator [Microbacterium sp. 1P10UB]|uniref:LacI family DNA-binding transcriptional regulator n=1 Tax=unclassified Microbacterium TaxID=2609290 RepID=UPI00399F92D7